MRTTIRVALPALIAGALAGAGLRAIATARAEAAAPFTYKIVDTAALINAVKTQNPHFKTAMNGVALEEGLNGFGRAGWRYAGCLTRSAVQGLSMHFGSG